MPTPFLPSAILLPLTACRVSFVSALSHQDKDDELPEIDIVIAAGDNDCTIKISDQGGGIPSQDISCKQCFALKHGIFLTCPPFVLITANKQWSYLHSTANHEDNQLDPLNLTEAPMAGLGYGLPLSRLFARYVGGDIELVSMEGYGVDVYVYLNRLNQEETLLQ